VSKHVNETVTFPLFHPYEFGPGVLEPAIAGGVLSMLIPATVEDAELPALSVHVPVRDWLLPSEETTWLPETESTPEKSSVHVNETVTSPPFQPFELAEGDRDPVRSGELRSMLMPPTVVLALFPARSTQDPVAD